MNTYIVSDGTLIKIGRSDNPWGRISGLQTAQANPLICLLILEGDQEKELHQRFDKYRVRGEWFEHSYEIRKFIAEANNQPLRMPFYVWLMGQKHRQDEVGRLAIAAQSHGLPKDANQLYVLRQTSKNRKFLEALDVAHEEWRTECGFTGQKYIRTSKKNGKPLPPLRGRK